MTLEHFIANEGGEGMSEAAFEAFKQKMQAAGAQVAAIKKEERKQKKKEEDLLAILLKFIKSSQKQDLVLLISRVLEQNIPANFILAIILLGNDDIQKEVGNYLMLGAGESIASEKALVFFSKEDSSLPLKLKIEMDYWIKNMLSQAEENPQKLLKTAFEISYEKRDEGEEYIDEYGDLRNRQNLVEVKKVKGPLLHLVAFVIRDFLEQKEIYESYEKLNNFAEFILTGILNKTKEGIDGRKLLS